MSDMSMQGTAMALELEVSQMLPMALSGSLRCGPGELLALVGPSGAGKTSLLRILAGLMRPERGRVVVGQEVWCDTEQGIFVPPQRRHVGLVFQNYALMPHLSALGNVALSLLHLPAEQRARQARHWLDHVGLSAGQQARRPAALSGGQQQRVAVARALAREPRLMLLDEPFSALDTGLRAATRKAVAQLLASAGITTILVTHDQSEALSFADQVAVMRAGQLVQVGAPVDVYLRPHDPATASFLGDTIVLPAQLADGWADCALGRIAVNQPARSGAAQIMLRPEQLQLAEVLAPSVDSAACVGEVTDIDFGGPVCVVSVRLQGAAASDAPLQVRSPGIHVPPVGATVAITVVGAAHVFSA